jgi:photosystem II stability/assembly factor-like uncharacterized protein
MKPSTPGQRPLPKPSKRMKWETRGAFMRRLLNASDPETLAKLLARGRAHRALMRRVSRRESDPDTALAVVGDIAGEAAAGLSVAQVSSDSIREVPGGTGVVVKVTAKTPFAHAVVRFALAPEAVTGVVPSSILMAWYDAEAKRFHLLPHSGFNARRGYVFGRVTRGGFYTAIGIPRDPRVQATVRMIEVSRRASAHGGVGFNDRICQVILCNPDMQKAVDAFRSTGSGALADAGFSPDDFAPPSGGGNVCQFCLGGGLEEFADFGFEIPDRSPPHFSPVDSPARTGDDCSRWESLGPDNVPGRMTSLAVHPSDGLVVYAGSADGGVFKTTNGGESWLPLWDQQVSLAVGAVAISPSHPNVVYASTGEWGVDEDLGVLTLPGVGLYRSTNSGEHWTLSAPIASRSTNAIAIHPRNPNLVFVAGSRSLHRTRDGGVSWDVVGSSVDGVPNVDGVFDGTISDVVIHPDSHELWVGVHGRGVWRSANSGDSFTVEPIPAAVGTPASSPRIAFGPLRADGSRRIAVKTHSSVFVNSGGGYQATATFDDLPWHPAYTNVIAMHPSDENIILTGNVILMRTVDGGSSWVYVDDNTIPADQRVHPDKQAIAFDASDPSRVYQATDGGVYVSNDHGQSWTSRSAGLTTSQCYSIGVTPGGPLAFGITTQDNACYRWDEGNAFAVIQGPEGGWIDYDHTGRIYVDTWFDPYSVVRSSDNGTTWTEFGLDTTDHLRHFFNRGMALPPGGSRTLLALRRSREAGMFTVPVMRSVDDGATWAEVLSVQNLEITAVAFARSSSSTAYAASVDGRLWHSTDEGASWNELNRGGPPAWVQAMEVDWSDPTRVYLAYAIAGVRQLWRVDTRAGVASWFDITGATPQTRLPDLALTGLVLHPDLSDTIYVSNSLGVYKTTDGGASWIPFDAGLPNALVSDLRIRRSDKSLYASTWGRGAFRRHL